VPRPDGPPGLQGGDPLEAGAVLEYESDTTDHDDVRTVSSVGTFYEWDRAATPFVCWKRRDTQEGNFSGEPSEQRPRRISVRTDRWSSERAGSCEICDYVVVKHLASHRCKACHEWARQTCGDVCLLCRSWYCLTCYYDHPRCHGTQKSVFVTRVRAGRWAVDRQCAVEAARRGPPVTGEAREAMMRYYRRRAFIVDPGRGRDWTSSRACPSCYRYVPYEERDPQRSTEARSRGLPDPVKRCGFCSSITHAYCCCSTCRYCGIDMCYPCLMRHYCAWSEIARRESYDFPFHMVAKGILLAFCSECAEPVCNPVWRGNRALDDCVLRHNVLN
jgi:hypothetical protein